VRGPFGIPHVNRGRRGSVGCRWCLVSCGRCSRISRSGLERTSSPIILTPLTARGFIQGPRSRTRSDHWFVRQADFKYVTDAAVNSAGVPKTDHRLVRLDLVFKFLPRRLRAVKPRTDRTLLEDPVLKLKFQELCSGLYRCGSERPVCCAYHTVPKYGCAYAAARSSGY